VTTANPNGTFKEPSSILFTYVYVDGILLAEIRTPLASRLVVDFTKIPYNAGTLFEISPEIREIE
jgi:hypothetical protein